MRFTRLQSPQSFFEKIQQKEDLLGVKKVAASYFLTHQKKASSLVLLVHGFSACPATLKDFGHFLHKQGFDVYGLRLAGHGISINAFEKSRWQDWETSLDECFRVLRPAYQKVMIAASSMGALLSLYLAPRLQLDKLLCMGSFFKAQDPLFNLCHILSPLCYLWPFTLGSVQNKTIPEEREGFWYSALPRRSVVELFRLQQQTKSMLHKVKTPILIAHSPEDPVAHPDSVDYLYEHIGSTQKERLWIGHEHVLVIDKDPQHYQKLYRFLAKA